MMNGYLILGGSLSALAAIMHVGCIIFGASWYRFFGAGEEMARMAEQGSATPTLVTLAIVSILLIWSAYAFSGAGYLFKLPFRKWVLVIITAIYCVRGLIGLVLVAHPIENSAEFWLWSSVICLTFGAVHFIGVKQVWHQL